MLVSNAIPGETVAVKVNNYKNDFAFASVEKVLLPSPDRVEPICPVFSECSGCHNQHITYSRQVSIKQEILSDCFKRVTLKHLDLSESLVGPDPWHFKYKGHFKLGNGRIGFARADSSGILDIEGCKLMKSGVNALFGESKKIYRDSPKLFGGISDLYISSGDDGLALLKSSSGMSMARSKQIGKLFLEAGFQGVCISIGKDSKVSFGKEYTTIDFNGIRYNISPRSSIQGNWDLSRSVVSFLRQTLHSLKGKRVIVLYAGGNFSLPFAADGAEVYAVGNTEETMNDLQKNAAANGIRNCRFADCSLERLKVSDRADVMVIASSGSELTSRAIEKIFTIDPDRIAYISCNPMMLSRDLSKLMGRYEIESMRIIDCFPQTYHVKSLAMLKLR